MADNFFDSRWRNRKRAEKVAREAADAKKIQGNKWIEKAHRLLAEAAELQTGTVRMDAKLNSNSLTVFDHRTNGVIAEYLSTGEMVEFEYPRYRPAGGAIPREFQRTVLTSQDDVLGHIDALLYKHISQHINVN